MKNIKKTGFRNIIMRFMYLECWIPTASLGFLLCAAAGRPGKGLYKAGKSQKEGQEDQGAQERAKKVPLKAFPVLG